MAYGNDNQTNEGFTSPYPKNITDDFNVLNLSSPNGQGGTAYFFIRFSGNKVRVAVSTKIPNDKNNGRMRCDMTIEQWYGFLSLLERVKDSPKRGIESVCYLELKFPKKDKFLTAGKFFVGKEEDGVIWITLYQHERPKIKFKLLDDNYASYCYASSGEKFTPEDSSQVLTSSYIHLGRSLMASVATQEYKDESDRPSYSKNNNNNNYNSNNNNSSYSDNSSEEEYVF